MCYLDVFGRVVISVYSFSIGSIWGFPDDMTVSHVRVYYCEKSIIPVNAKFWTVDTL